MRWEEVFGIYSLLNDVTGWRTCSGVSRGCVNKIRLWPLRRDDRSGVLIGAVGTRRSDWLECLGAVGIHARSGPLHASTEH